jgi:hypothetical protein
MYRGRHGIHDRGHPRLPGPVAGDGIRIRPVTQKKQHAFLSHPSLPARVHAAARVFSRVFGLPDEKLRHYTVHAACRKKLPV